MPAKQFVKSKFIKSRTIEARSFQAKLAESVLKGGNSLIVAPTALGKTIVATLVIASVLEKEPGKKILFLAPTKPLCEQHQKSMRKFLKLKEEDIVLLTGSLVFKKRAKKWEKAKIVVATPQTIANDARQGRISLKELSLAVFDEAHRAVGEYAYVYIARKFSKGKGLVLGLTASPGGKESHIKEVCRSLSIKNIEIKGLEDEDVIPYSHEIKVEWRMVSLPEKFEAMKKLIEAFMKKQASTLKKFGFAKSTSPTYFGKGRLIEMQNSLRRRISSNPKNMSLFAAVSAVAALMKASHAHTLLETQGVNALHQYFEREKGKKGKVSKATSRFLASMEIVQAAEMAEELSVKGEVHPKLLVLKEELKKQFEVKPESSAIVFNHYRDSIRRLVEELNKMPGIRAEKFVGQAAKGEEKGMTQKEQAAKIQELKERKLNVLVASSVAEEGLDIPSVDLVVFYEPVPSEIRFIQRRGRTGRLAAGKAIILMARGTRDETYYWTSVRKEKKMHHILHKMKRHSQNIIGDSQDIIEPDTSTQEPSESKPSKEKQTTLHSFDSGGEDKIVVYVDAREKESGVARMLEELGCSVVEKQLEVADYIPGKEIAVERKAVSDFVSSIVDGRLNKQLINMAECYERPLVIVEGDKEKMFESNVHRNAIIGMLTSIALNYRVPVLFTDSARETAQYIYLVAKREQLGKGTDVRLRIGRKGLTLGEQQRFVVESLPLIGPKMARSLLEKFGSVKGIVNAQSKQLQEVENMGQKKAKLVRQVLLSEYGEKD
jgi:Fanconi anemia group M protein